MRISKRLAALALTAALWPGAARADDCDKFDRGTEILSNILARYYQPNEDVTAFVHRILGLVRKNVVEAKTLEDANLLVIPAGGACAASRAKAQELSTLMGNEIRALDQALAACRPPILERPGSEDECHEKALAALKIDREIGRDEEGPAVAPQDGKLVRYMVTLGGSPCGNPASLQVQQRVHALVAPTWCGRFGPEDKSLCYSIRIGKMRQAQGLLGQVRSPEGAVTAYRQAKPLLHAHKGDGACKPDIEDGGAEGNLWCLRDHPDYDNAKIFDSVLEVTKAVRMLRAANSAACGN